MPLTLVDDRAMGATETHDPSFDHAVRMAQPQDEDGVLELCRILHGENGIFPLDEFAVREMIGRAWKRDGVLLGVIGQPGGPLRGCILMDIQKMWYSEQWFVNELFNFVHPDHRRSNYAKELIGFAQKCADELGIPLITGIISNTRTEAKVRLYERMLPRVGAFFCYQPKMKRN